jgi:thymidylate synthase (FAD)
MSETTLNVKLIAHTRISDDFLSHIGAESFMHDVTDGQLVALSAIRSCYSPLKPSDIVVTEGDKYFGKQASDGKGGSDAERLIRQVISSKHLSTIEHLSFTFSIEGVSRALLAQLTRHRVGFSFSVQSQRYVKLGSKDKSGGFDYVIPDTIKNDETARAYFELLMLQFQSAYDTLRQMGIPSEDARSILPNATATNLTMTANLRALLDFYSKRRSGRGAQSEIVSLAETLRQVVCSVEPWLDQFFEEV